MSLPWESIPRRGIDSISRARDLAERGPAGGGGCAWSPPLSATAAGPASASVQPLELSPDHPLARTSGAGNALVVELAGGETSSGWRPAAPAAGRRRRR